MPVPQRLNLIVGWAGEPTHKRLIDNGNISVLIVNSYSAPAAVWSKTLPLK
jgi:hypothetical protein